MQQRVDRAHGRRGSVQQRVVTPGPALRSSAHAPCFEPFPSAWFISQLSDRVVRQDNFDKLLCPGICGFNACQVRYVFNAFLCVKVKKNCANSKYPAGFRATF